MPYPLPEDVGAVTGVRWFLVCVPDDPAYTRAAWGAYSDLGHYWKWGVEGPVPVDSDLAAQQWLDAIGETIEAYEMGFPEVLLGHIDGVEGLLQELIDRPCCDGGTLYEIVGDPGGVIQPLPDTGGEDIVRGVGDPPGGVVDWPTYDQRLCEAAARFADALPAWVTALEIMSAVVGLGLITAAAYLIAGLAAAGIAGAVVAGALGLLEAVEWMDDLRDLFSTGPSWDDARTALGLQDTKDAIICAILLSETPAEAETAVDAALQAEAPDAYQAIKTLPLRFMMNTIFNMESDAGGFGGYTCPDCEEPVDLDLTFDFVGGAQGWERTGTGNGTWVNASPPFIYAERNGSLNAGWRMTNGDIAALSGLSSGTYQLVNVVLTFQTDNVVSNNVSFQYVVRGVTSSLLTTAGSFPGALQDLVIDYDASGTSTWTMTPAGNTEIVSYTTVGGNNTTDVRLMSCRVRANVV